MDIEIVDNLNERWTSPEYTAHIEEIFNQLDQYLKTPPKRILDIGCGFAGVSERFQKKYGTELYLLEGDFSSNTETATRKGKYGSKETFKFYMPVSLLKEHWDSRGIKYTFVDANNIDVPEDIKFDFVSSWISCGYHYPVNTYRDFIKKHVTEDSVIVMDFRRKSLGEQMVDFDIVHSLTPEDGSKKSRLHIKFKN